MAENVRLGGVVVDFIARNAEFLRAAQSNVNALRRQGAEARRFKRAVRDLRRDTRALTSSIETLGRRMALAVTAGVAFSVRSFANLEQTLASVRGITGATVNEFELLANQARLLGRTTRFTAQQAAEGQLFLARAGFEVNQIYSALPGTLQLAQAATVELGEAADIVSNVLASFRAGAEETRSFGDVLAKTTISANTNLTQLADAIKLVGPISASLGISLETTAASIGILSNAGLQASLAGTGLRRVLFNLEAPTTAITSILHDLNLQVNDVSISQNGLIAVLERLNDAGISAAQAIELFGARGAPAFNVLVAAIPQLRQLEGVLQSSAGTMAELARIQDDTLTGSFFRSISAADGLGRTLVRLSGFGAALRSRLDTLADSINQLTDFVSENIRTILDRARVAAELFIGVFLIRGPLGRAVINLAVLARGVGLLTAALTVATGAARLLYRALLIGFIIEGFLLAIDAVAAFSEAVSEAKAGFLESFATPILDALSDIANSYRKLNSLIDSTVIFVDPVEDLDFAATLLGAEAAERARHAGDRFAEIFGEAVRIRLSLFGLGERAAEDLLPQLGPPSPVPSLPVPGAPFEDALAGGGDKPLLNSIVFLERTLDLERRISRQIEDSAQARERSVELIGLSGEALAVAEARLAVIAQFEDERLRITRELADSFERSDLAAVGASRAIMAGNAELERSALSVLKAARARQAVLQLDLTLLDEQIIRVELLTEAAEREAQAQAAVDRAVAMTAESFDVLESVVENAGNAVSEFVGSSVTGFENVRDAVRRLGQAIVADLTRNLISKPLTGFLSQLLGGFSGSFGGGAAGGAAAGGFQRGGLADRGFAVVGEGGPELVDFRNPGRVYTNEQLGAALAGNQGTTVNYAPTINNSDEVAVERALVDFLPTLVDVVKGATARDASRPGPGFA